jgi:hypothetical protein
VLRRVVAHGDQRRGADRDRVGAEGQRLRDVGAGPDPAGHDQLHLPVHTELLERVHGQPDGRQRRDADVLDEDVLCRRRPSLHAVHDDDVGARLDRELDVVVRAGGADLDEDRLLPVGDLAQLADLDLEVVGPGPIGMAAGTALVDPLRQVAHLGDAVGDLVPEEHAAPARLRALTDDHLDRIGLAEVVRVHAVARGEELVDEGLRVLPLLRRHPAVARGRRGPHFGGPASKRLLGRGGEGAEAHPGDRDRDAELERALRKPRPQGDVRVAPLAVALERVARDAGAEEEQVVEVGHAPLGAEPADVVDALARGALDLRDDGLVVEVGLAQVPGTRGHQYAPALSTLKV